jgi:hypothetical protein
MPYQYRYPARYPGETEALGLDPANEPGPGDALNWEETFRGGDSE